MALLSLAPLGVCLGLWMQHRNGCMVYRRANLLLFITGWKLILDGISMLTAHGVPHA